MSKHLLRDLPELVSAHIISPETAERIRTFYAQRQESTPNRLLVVFGILGALLTGLGIILIIAHNWYNMGKVGRLIIAFLPMLAGQIVCGYTLFKNNVNPIWKESSATFLFFSIGASISIVSQVYNIDGKLGEFLFWWMILSLPVIYVMPSSMVSLLYLVGITWYACSIGYFEYPQDNPVLYWPLLLAVIPHYTSLSGSHENFFNFHSWLISISLVICLGTLSSGNGELMTVAYMGMFCVLLLLGQMEPFSKKRLITNAFLAVGSVGIISILLYLSFRDFWYGLGGVDINFRTEANELSGAIISTLLAAYMIYRKWRLSSWRDINPKSWAFVAVILLFVVGFSAPFVSVVAVNLLLFSYSVTTIVSGSRAGSFGILNYGLLILTALITCRFFDTDLSFIIRGLLFVGVGAGFFLLNYYMIKRKSQAS